MKTHNQIDAIISCFASMRRDTVREREHRIAITESGREETFIEDDREWRLMYHEHPSPEDEVTECVLRFALVRGSACAACIGVEFTFKNWSTDNYVMMPAAVYAGNRFRAIQKEYPPMLHGEDCIGSDMQTTITDIPRLEIGDGVSLIHLRSGDLATPCVCVREIKQGRGFILLGEHMVLGAYTGFSLRESGDRSAAYIRYEAPAVRERMYTMCTTETKSDDEPRLFNAGDVVQLRFKLVRFSCPDISALFTRFFGLRKSGYDSTRMVHGLPLSRAFGIIEEKYNRSQWNEAEQYYRVAPSDCESMYGEWQAGWVGGGMVPLAFICAGTELSRERSLATMESIFSVLQAESGFIRPIKYKGALYGDDFQHTDKTEILLLRKNADILLFASRFVYVLRARSERESPTVLAGITRLADAFVRLWKRYGQFGQFIDLEKETILIGGSASSGIAPGALALAAKLLNRPEYWKVAVESANYYYDNFVKRGITNGGPGEILQCPDSESSFGLLESFVELYECSGDSRWLRMAEDSAHIASSWTVSYDFIFPKTSEFGKLDLHTTGSVWANAQNKHSAPGICTLSPVALLKLYRATENDAYLDLARDIAHNVTQYLSYADRPIHTLDGRVLPAGWMCERVNMSDWETKEGIGAVFYGSNWCEVSVLLTYTELPGILFRTDSGKLTVFDHVDASVSEARTGWDIIVKNPTAFAATVTLQMERGSDFHKPLGAVPLANCKMLFLNKGETKVFRVARTPEHKN